MKKIDLVTKAMDLALKLGYNKLVKLPRTVVVGALLDGDELMNLGYSKIQTVEELSGPEYRGITKKDWILALPTIH